MRCSFKASFHTIVPNTSIGVQSINLPIYHIESELTFPEKAGDIEEPIDTRNFRFRRGRAALEWPRRNTLRRPFLLPAEVVVVVVVNSGLDVA